MQPYKVQFYVYADNMEEVKALENTLRAFVESKRERGIAVTATRLTQALERFKNNIFVTQYLR